MYTLFLLGDNYRMITYCIGDIHAKRRAFRLCDDAESLYVDNDDVLCCFKLDGRFYCAVAKPAFAQFSAEQYLLYHRALCSSTEASRRLSAVGAVFSTKRKVGTLNGAEYRALRLACMLDVTHKKIAINLDGIAYSRAVNKSLNALIKALCGYELFLLVSDMRFVKNNSIVTCFGEGGKATFCLRRPKKAAKQSVSLFLKQRGTAFADSLVETVTVF